MLQHKGTQTIETKRLILRRAKMEDAQAMFDNWASDPEVTKFLTWPTHKTLEDTREILSLWIAEYEKEDFYQWTIELKEIGAPIGSISVVSQDDRIQKAEIGYCIGKSWWRRGITSEAMQAVMDFLFDEVGMNRVESRHDPNNPHSGGVMRKCGLEYEGTRRQSDINNQGLCDTACYGLVKCRRQQKNNIGD